VKARNGPKVGQFLSHKKIFHRYQNFRGIYKSFAMPKRTAEDGRGSAPMKGGERPDPMDIDSNKEVADMGDFEDDFEDEFDSEEETLEAGVDGRPDAEREADAVG
jgi:hypothetical protein